MRVVLVLVISAVFVYWLIQKLKTAMNKAQSIICIAGLLGGLAMIAYPPWNGMPPPYGKGVEYGPITWILIDPDFLGKMPVQPAPEHERLGAIVYSGMDFGRLLFQLFCVALVVEMLVRAQSTKPAEQLPTPSTTPPDDIEIRLQRLEGLKENGLLTDAEYQAKREEILGEV